MITISLSLCALLFTAMLLRFVQPKLLYGVRRVLRQIRLKRAALEYDAGRSTAGPELYEWLARDGRPETTEARPEDALRRAYKLRELYQLLGQAQSGIGTGDTRVCVSELSDIVRNLVDSVTPNIEYSRRTVYSGGILRHIATCVKSDDDPRQLTDETLGQWYLANPVSIEQIVELLVAAVQGLSFRILADEKKGGSAEPIMLANHLATLEVRLRQIIEIRYRLQFPTAHPEDRIREKLGEKEFRRCSERRDRAIRDGDMSAEILSFLNLKQILDMILGDWPLFQSVFPDREVFISTTERIRSARNSIFHARQIAQEEEAAVLASCGEIIQQIRRALGY